MSLSLPVQLTQVFCSAGVKNTIPNPSQIPTNAGLASFTDGFPPATRAPVAAGGIPPYGEDINGILNQLSGPIQWNQAGGAYPYSSAYAAAIGGYPVAATTYSSDGSGYWMNTTANNSNDPENSAFPTGWQPIDQRGITAVPLTNANVTLTNLQSAKSVIVFSGTLTANVVITWEPYIMDVRFVNQTSGAFSVSVKTPTGAAVAVPQGGKLEGYGDGTNLNVVASAIAGGLVGQARNLRAYLAAAGTGLTFTADEVLVETALGGIRYVLPSFNQAVSTTATGIGGVVGTALTASGYAAVYAAYNPTTGAQGAFITNANTLQPNVAASPPAGWVATGLISVWPLNSSTQFVVGEQVDREISRQYAQCLTTTSVPTVYTSLSIASAVPLNARTVSGSFHTITASAGGGALSVAADSVGTGQQLVGGGGVTGSGFNGSFSNVPLATAQTLYYGANGSMSQADLGISRYTI